MDRTEADWIVVLEVGGAHIPESSLRPLLQILGEVEVVALDSIDRYAVRMKLSAAGHADALFVALARWRSALAPIGEARLDIVRAEVLSPEEFEFECRRTYDGGTLRAEEATQYGDVRNC